MKLIKLVILLGISGLFSALNALKVGVVNVSQLLEQVPQAQAATVTLQNEFSENQRTLIALQSELQQLQARYETDAPVMAQDARATLERELMQAQRDFERESATFSEDLNIRRNEELTALQGLIFEQIQLFAATGNFDLIVADALYYSDTIDITGELLDAMQELFSSN
jgi:outer membrane protein